MSSSPSTPTPAPGPGRQTAPPRSATEQARTQSTYGLQWDRYRIVRAEEDRATFQNRTGLRPQDLDGKVVLDAGCGMGRYARIAAGSSARLVVGVDLTRAIFAARDLTRELPRVALVRGDLLCLPFAPGSFDLIYSLGVIDHVPDPRAAFLALARLLRPGGRIVVWVYPRERRLVERMMDLQRAVSTRVPVRLLERLCRLAAPIGGWKRSLMASRFWIVQRLGVAVHLATIGVSMHPDPEVRACDTLDWYAPRHLSRHTRDEVAGWFAEAGLVNLVDLGRNQTFFHEGQGNGVNWSGERPHDCSTE